MNFKCVSDIKLKEKLKSIVRECINTEAEIYGDFKPEYIEKSGFDFCPIETQFFQTGFDIEVYASKFIEYCLKNNYNELFIINPEYMDDESPLEDYFSAYPGSTIYLFSVVKDDILYSASNFDYSRYALIFPKDRSFIVLMTDDYDILGGNRKFIEFITESNILEKVDSFEDLSLIKRNKYYVFLANKYKKLLHDKYGK